MAFLTASHCLTFSALKSMFSRSMMYLSFEIREIMNTILYCIALIPLKSHLLPSGSHIFSCFSARAKIPFRLHEIFSARGAIQFHQTGLGFSARAELHPGLNPSPCHRQFDFKKICFRGRAEIRHAIRPLGNSV